MRADADFFCLPIEKIHSEGSEVYITKIDFYFFWSLYCYFKVDKMEVILIPPYKCLIF